MSDIGQFIKYKREAANISQKELGRMCGISDSAIHNIEIGKTKNPRWELLCKIAEMLEIHPLEIMKEAGYITDKDINPVFLLKGIDKLNVQEREIIQLFIDFILSRSTEQRIRKRG